MKSKQSKYVNTRSQDHRIQRFVDSNNLLSY